MHRKPYRKPMVEGVYYSPSRDVVDHHRRYPDSEYFASKIEMRVYQHLLSFEDIKISRQYPLTIKDATGAYPKKVWRCDFRIQALGQPELFMNIEAKGTLFLEKFKHQLQYLDFFSPSEYQRLLIVSRDTFKIDEHNITRTPLEMMFILKEQGFK